MFELTSTLTQHSERDVGGDHSCCVFGRAAVHTHVLRLHVHYEEHIIIGHHLHAPFTGCREIRASVFLPSNLRRWITFCRTLQAGLRPSPDGEVTWGLHKRRQYCVRVGEKSSELAMVRFILA